MLLTILALLLAASNSEQNAIVIEIASLPKEVAINRPAMLEITISNKGTKDALVDGLGQIELLDSNGQCYWAPFKIVEGVPAQANEKLHKITISKGVIHKYHVNISSLYWAKCIAAQWPEQSMNKVVAPGKYNLRLIIGRQESSSSNINVR